MGKKEIYANRGTILFEKDLFYNSTNLLECDLIADPDCLMLEADMSEFSKLLGGSVQDILEKSIIIDTLQKVPLFRNFSLQKLEHIAQTIKTEKYKNGEKIITEGEEGSTFYIVKNGKIDIYITSQYLRTLNEYDFFGERSLFVQEPRSATAVANKEVIVYVLEKDDFKKMCEGNLKDFIMSRIALQDNTIELKDLVYIKNLGAGNFGNVYLVKSQKNKNLYAIKSISKAQIDQEQLHPNLDMERKILLQIDHPFIMKMVKTLKDSKNIYFLTEFIRGKELFDVIRDIGLLNKTQTQFYSASLMIALDYLHKRKFIYRDVKPENVIVAEKVKYNIIIFRDLLN